MVMTQPGFAYEPDGDSIFGALLPNVYVSNVTLEPNGPELNINVNLVFKEKIEPDDISLFAIDKITDALKLRIVMSTNKNVTEYISNGGMSVLNKQEMVYDQKNLASYLASNKLEQFSQENDNVQIHTVGLKEITQANGMIALPNNDDAADIFQSSLEKEALSDGTVLYNTPYSAPSFTVSESAGGQGPGEVAIFIITYVDFDAILDAAGVNMAFQFVGQNKDQFESLGYNTETTAGKIAAGYQLQKLFEDYGLGIPTGIQVIHHKKVQNYNDEFVYADGPKKGKVWNGLVHYHSPSNPAPDGWVGYMGGAAEHMGSPSISNPKLNIASIDMSGQITDLRPLLNTDPLIEPPSLENPNPAPLFSTPYYSLHGNGQSSFMFSFDASQALADNTPNPEFLTFLQSESPQKYSSLLSQATITNLNVSRQQMGMSTDENGNPTLVPGGSEAHEIINVVYSSDVGGSLKTSANSLTTGTGVLGDGLNSSDTSNGSIKEITLLSSNNGLRHFGITDSAIAKLNEGIFQYSVEIEMGDPVETLVSQAMSTITNAKLEVEKYLDLIEAGGSKYYKSNGKFTKKFADKYFEIYKISSFQQANLYKAVKAFFDNVVKELPVLKGNTKQQKNQLEMIVLQQMNPKMGNKNNVEIGLQTIKNVESELLQITSHEPSSKDSTSASDTVESGLSSGAGKEKNVFKLSHSFSTLFDTNADATRGYEYVFSDTVDEKPSTAPGLAVISVTNYEGRASSELFVNQIPSSYVNFSESDPSISSPTYMAPRVVKVAGKTIDVNPSTSADDYEETMVNIMGADDISVPNISPDPSPPSPLGLFGGGVSVAPAGTWNKTTTDHTSNPPEDIESASSTNDSYETSTDNDIIAITPLLIKLLLGEKTNIKFDDYLVFNDNGTFNTANAIGSFLATKKAFDGKGGISYAKELNKIPNHVKKLLDDIIISKSEETTLDQTKTNFEQIPNLIKMLFIHKNLMKVEVLTGYGVTNADGTQMKSPNFELLDSIKLGELKDSGGSNTHVLARLRPYDQFGAFIQPNSMKIPVFNEYFFLNLATPAPTAAPSPPPAPSAPATDTQAAPPVTTTTTYSSR